MIEKVDRTEMLLIDQSDLRLVERALKYSDCTGCWKRLKTQQVLNKLGNFCSHAITKIRTLVSAYYAFCKRPDTLGYVAELLKNDKFLWDNIENIGNQKLYYRISAYRLTNYI